MKSHKPIKIKEGGLCASGTGVCRKESSRGGSAVGSQVQPPPTKTNGKTVLFVPDIGNAFPLYPKKFAQYFKKDRPDMELLIYLPEMISSVENVQTITNILKDYEDCDTCVTLQTGTDLDEHMLFQYVDQHTQPGNRPSDLFRIRNGWKFIVR